MTAPRAAAALAALLACACATPEIEPRYRPSASALEIIAVLERHVPDDTYRFEPARDFTDRNVYRSSLLRLENLEQRFRRFGGPDSTMTAGPSRGGGFRVVLRWRQSANAAGAA